MVGYSTCEMNPKHWGRVVPILTLDVVNPLFGLMGLQTNEPAGLQQILREEMIKGRRRFKADPSQLPVTPEGIFASIEARLGQREAQQLAWWISRVFHGTPYDGIDLRKWAVLLRYCRNQNKLWERLGFPESLRVQALERFCKSINIDELNRCYEEQEARPLSDWDVHLYAIYFYDDDDSEGTPNGPRLWVTPTVRDFQGYQFWSWVVGELNQEQINWLWRCGQKLAVDENLLSAEELPSPINLDIGI